MIKTVITDLDGTLYDWVGFFVPAFYKMVEELSKITYVDTDTLIAEYKEVHQRLGGTEIPYVTRQLPSIKKKFGDISNEELDKKLNSSYYAFNSYRKHNLEVFPNVKSTLEKLISMDIKLIAFTESALENGYYRLRKLSLDQYFSRIYVADSGAKISCSMKEKVIPQNFSKPDINVLENICKIERLNLKEILYIGDSLTKDIFMANSLGIKSVLVKLSKNDSANYQKLVKISHWTEKDFEKERILKNQMNKQNIEPDFTILNWSEVISIVEYINRKKFD